MLQGPSGPAAKGIVSPPPLLRPGRGNVLRRGLLSPPLPHARANANPDALTGRMLGRVVTGWRLPPTACWGPATRCAVEPAVWPSLLGDSPAAVLQSVPAARRAEPATTSASLSRSALSLPPPLAAVPFAETRTVAAAIVIVGPDSGPMAVVGSPDSQSSGHAVVAIGGSTQRPASLPAPAATAAAIAVSLRRGLAALGAGGLRDAGATAICRVPRARVAPVVLPAPTGVLARKGRRSERVAAVELAASTAATGELIFELPPERCDGCGPAAYLYV
jgi:hypothetical protein